MESAPYLFPGFAFAFSLAVSPSNSALLFPLPRRHLTRSFFPFSPFRMLFPNGFLPFILRLLFFYLPFFFLDSYSSCFLSFFCFSKTTTLFFFLPNPISRFPTPLAQNLLPDFPVLLRNRLFRFFYPPISLFPYFFSEGCPLSSVFFTNYPLNDEKTHGENFPCVFSINQ